MSTLGVIGNLQGRCYQYLCYSNYTIKFQFSSGNAAKFLYCYPNDTLTNKTINGLFGQLTCPDFKDFCKNSRKLCINWCSQHGYCTGGICNCDVGYSG